MNTCSSNVHEFTLAGYRDRPVDQTGTVDHSRPFIQMHAVFVCLHCPAEKLIGITCKPPAPVVEMSEPKWDHAAALRHSNPVARTPADDAYWARQSALRGRFEPLEALETITHAVVGLAQTPHHAVGITVMREARALRAYIRGLEGRR